MPPGVGAQPPQSDELINSLDERLQQLQSTVAALVERTAHAATVPGEASADAEVVAASRTLQMAKQTADASIAEAKEEAAQLVADAQKEHDSILRTAREAADKELGTQRDALSKEQALWEDRKRKLTAVFEDLDRQFGEYGDRLGDAHAIVRAALQEPELVPEPEPEVSTESVADEATEGSAGEPVIDLTVDSSTPDAPAVPEAPAASGAETVFGTPPAPVFASQGGDGGTSQAFYPWSGGSTPPPVGPTDAAEEAKPEDVQPPVQRRGLFGH